MSLPKGFLLAEEANLESVAFSEMHHHVLKKVTEEAVYRKDSDEATSFSKILNDEMSFTGKSTILNLTFKFFNLPSGDVHVQPSIPLDTESFHILKRTGVVKADSTLFTDRGEFREVSLFTDGMLSAWVPDSEYYPSFDERFRKLLIKIYYRKLIKMTTFVPMTADDFRNWGRNTKPGGLLLMHLPLSYVYPEVVEDSVSYCEDVIKRNPVYTD